MSYILDFIERTKKHIANMGLVYLYHLVIIFREVIND